MSLFDYFLKVNLFLLVFYGCYWLWLRQHTFFSLNRAYLLLSVVLSLILPLIELPTEAIETINMPLEAISLPVASVESRVESAWSQELTLWLIYGLPAVGMLIRLLIRIMGVLRLIIRSRRERMDGYTLVFPEEAQVPTFSFFRYLVLNPADAEGNYTVIGRHELVHIRQWHSLDVLFLEFVYTLFWINPVLIAYKRAIQEVHEFLADRQADDKQQYANFLVEYAFGVRPPSFVAPFFSTSNLKQRLLMLQKSETNHWALGKYLLVVLPTVALLATMAACESQTTTKEADNPTPAAVTSREMVVEGVIMGKDGQPLPGASIVIDGMHRGTTTNAAGRFKINAPANSRLSVAFNGFRTMKVPVNGRKALHISLSQSTATEVSEEEDQKDIVPKPSFKSESDVFTVVEKQPEFPGGWEAAVKYFTESIRYPAAAQRAGVAGRVFLAFVVNTDGSISNIEVLKGRGFGLDEEAVRVVQQMPKWKPGSQEGKPVRVRYNLPINFDLSN